MEEEEKCFLDMTFGTGVNSAFLLKHASTRNITMNLVASDCFPSVVHTAKEMERGHPTSVVTPIQSK